MHCFMMRLQYSIQYNNGCHSEKYATYNIKNFPFIVPTVIL
jgi:hypothetical protein